GAGYVDVAAIQQILDYMGTPYTLMDVNTLTPASLSDGACHGYFQGVIMAYGNDLYINNGAIYNTLNNYEMTFKVRQINWNFNPAPQYGLNYVGTIIPATPPTTYTAYFTAAAATAFPGINTNTTTPLTFTGAQINLSPLSPLPPNLTPLI